MVMEEEDCIIGGEGDDDVSTVSTPPPKHEEETEAEDADNNLVEEILGVIDTVSSYSNYRKTQRKDCYNLVRRMKLLIPLLEEIRDLDAPIPDSGIRCLRILKKALLLANRLLRNCNQGSKIYLAFECETIFARFHLVHDKFGQALDNFAYDELGISDEVKEQVELMRVQLKRAKRRTDTQDIELAMDMLVVFSQEDDRNADSAIFERLGKKLDLHSIEDLKAETIAIRKLMKDPRGLNNGKIEKMLHVLSKFKEIMGMEETTQPVTASVLNRCSSLAIPHEFLCPITLEIMTDPVIVASGQTYERESIQKWLDSSHRTCPKSGQALDHLSLAPNYALKNIISQWCEKNNFKLVKHDEKPSTTDSENSSIEQLKESICSLVHSLSSSQLQVQRKAVKKIRMLSKENPENRVLIADSGGIPPLVQLLSYPDSKIQEHSVTALLNLSIDEINKKLITSQGAIPSIIEVLKHGNIGAKENSAAALFSLSMMDENKVSIGLSDGIPPLVDLLQHGTIRGKKDAITALFNLCLNQFNRGKAIEHGIIQPLMSLVKDRKLDMIDEALSIILLISSHPNGRQEIGQMSFIEVLVGYMGEGSEKNKECATAVLLELGTNNSSFMLAALQYGVYDHLVQIHKTGTNRAQRKANSLLQLMTKYEQIP